MGTTTNSLILNIKLINLICIYAGGSYSGSGNVSTPGGMLANRHRLTRAVSRLHATVRAMEMSPDLSRYRVFFLIFECLIWL